VAERDSKSLDSLRLITGKPDHRSVNSMTGPPLTRFEGFNPLGIENLHIPGDAFI